MLYILRDLFRHKGRLFLTVFGITIGIFAVTVMGSLSERIAVMLDNADVFISSRIQLEQESDIIGQSAFPNELIDKVREVDGVREVMPGFAAVYQEEGEENGQPGSRAGIAFGLTSGIVLGQDPALIQDAFNPIKLQSGRWLEGEEVREAVVGAEMVKKFGIDPNNLGKIKIKIEDEEFEIVGVLDKTQIIFADSVIAIPLKTAWRVYGAEGDPVTAADVLPKDGFDADEVAARITEKVDGVRATSPKTLKDNIQRNLLIFRLITLSSAILAAVIGALSIINTMVIAVSERQKEIGIKKAVGATTTNIMNEFLTESTVIGALGGVFGIGLGYIAVYFLNQYTAKQGIDLFFLTPRLAAIAFVFALFLGIVAGLYPARKAAGMDPVKALKNE